MSMNPRNNITLNRLVVSFLSIVLIVLLLYHVLSQYYNLDIGNIGTNSTGSPSTVDVGV